MNTLNGKLHGPMRKHAGCFSFCRDCLEENKYSHASLHSVAAVHHLDSAALHLDGRHSHKP